MTTRKGRLELTRGAARLTIRGASIPELFRTRFDRPVPQVSVDGGVAHLDADLRDLRLESVEVRHGASRVELRLPRPSGVVPVRIGGGASHVRIRRPAGTPARLRVGRGVADLTFDEQELGAVGGRLRLESPQAGGADGRYEIEIDGGANHVQVTTEEGDTA